MKKEDRKGIICIAVVFIAIISYSLIMQFVVYPRSGFFMWNMGYQQARNEIDEISQKYINGTITNITIIWARDGLTGFYVSRCLVLLYNATMTEKDEKTTIYQIKISEKDYGLLLSYLDKKVLMTLKYDGIVLGYRVKNIEGVIEK